MTMNNSYLMLTFSMNKQQRVHHSRVDFCQLTELTTVIISTRTAICYQMCCVDCL